MYILKSSCDGKEQTDEPPSQTVLEEKARLGSTVIPGPSTGSASLTAGTLRTSPSNERRTSQKQPVSAHFNDWRWQMSNRIRTIEQLVGQFPNLANQNEIAAVAKRYPMAITPYYASLIRRLDFSDPIFTMSIPQISELSDPAFLSADPLEETKDMPVPGLVHRYPDRALIIATTACASYCRHCTRKRIAGTREVGISQARLRQIIAYLGVHPEISDVIVSGGDPFTLTTQAIEQILIALRSVPSVDIIRLGTRTPVVLPMRITNELVTMLRKYHPIWINTHFNHPDEITEQSRQACAKLVDAGFPLGNQSVLLRGVNDDPKVFEKLCKNLIKNRVRPYYLFQCDIVKGVEHFRTPISSGIQIMEYLRGRVSGLAIPLYIVDAPHGGGKIPILPNYVVSVSPTHTVLRNYEGMLVSYPEPAADVSAAKDKQSISEGDCVWSLSNGDASAIIPGSTKRHQRRQNISQANNLLAREKF
jgi:lysine 2,3-aminomutase